MIVVREEESSHLVNGVDYDRKVRTVKETDTCELKEEVLNGVLFFHLYVYEFTPSVYKMMKREWEAAKKRAKDEGWDACYSYSQNHAFIKRFGGTRVATVIGLTGEEFGVYQWDLN